MVFDGFKKQLLRQIVIASSILLILALFIILLNWDINKRAASIEESKIALELEARTVQLLGGASGDLKKVEPMLAELRSLLPAKDDLINLPRELERVGKQYAVTVGFGFSTEEPATEKLAGTISFKLTVSGSYDDIVDFLKYIEAHRYIISLYDTKVDMVKTGFYSLFTTGQIYVK